MFKVVSFYTDEFYKGLACRLSESAGRWGIPCEISFLEGRGSWLQNVLMKPKFILSNLNQTAQDVVWMDSDSYFVGYPELFNQPFPHDLAVYKYPELYLATVIYFRNNSTSKRFIELWDSLSKDLEPSDPLAGDQKTFQWAVKEFGIRIYDLPPEYHWIRPVFDSVYPGRQPVIEHDLVHQKQLHRKSKGG